MGRRLLMSSGLHPLSTRWAYCICIFVCLHTRTCLGIRTYIPTYMHTCVHAYMHTCIHTYMHACMHIYIHTLTHTWLTLVVMFRCVYSCVMRADIQRYSIGALMHRYSYTYCFDEVRLCIAAPFSTESCSCFSLPVVAEVSMPLVLNYLGCLSHLGEDALPEEVEAARCRDCLKGLMQERGLVAHSPESNRMQCESKDAPSDAPKVSSESVNVGSLGHPIACRRPCVHMMAHRHCRNGSVCRYCHFPHPREARLKQMKVVSACVN